MLRLGELQKIPMSEILVLFLWKKDRPDSFSYYTIYSVNITIFCDL